MPLKEVADWVQGEDNLTDAEGSAYCISWWVWGEKGEGGWGLSMKLDESLGSVNTIRFQSAAYEAVHLDYKLVELGTITSMEFKDADGDNEITVGSGEAMALNFDYIKLNGGVISGGEYGQANFTWTAIVDGEEMPLDQAFKWDKDWGWDSYPTNGGYWFNPIIRDVTIRATLKDTDLSADYFVTVSLGTKGKEYDPLNPDTSGEVSDPGKNKSGYKLIWSDEFDGNYGSDNVDKDTGLNLDKWSYQQGNGTVEAGLAGWGNSERQSYTNRSKNIAVNENDKGLLRITASYEKDGYAYGKESKSYYTSARIVTKGTQETGPLFTTTYGYVEARMALPETIGAWPAFWMLPQSADVYGAWPVSGEIDIMETCGYREDEACATLHWGSPDHVYLGSGYQSLGSGMSYFHTYAVDWEPGKITFYYDGKAIYTQTNWESKIPGASSSLSFDAPFDQPYYILLNMAVDSGTFGGADNKATFQDDINMYVDYVRVYQKEGGYDTTNVRRTMQNSKNDWASQTGNQIASISADNVVAAENGDVNALETKGSVDADKWYLAYTEGGAATVEPVTKDGSEWAKVDVTNAGIQNYSVQLIGHYNAKKGYLYKVSFDAYAQGDLVGQTASCDSKEWKGWGTYGITSFVLEDTPTSYSFLIDQQTDFDNCRIEMNLGKIGTGTAYVGNMKVEIVDPATLGDDPARDSKPLASGEYLYNGTFDQGNNNIGYWKAAEGTNFSVPAYTTESSGSDDIGVEDVAAGVKKYFGRRAQISSENGESTIYQSGFVLPEGEYTLTFDMYSEAAATVKAAIASVDTKEDGSETLGVKLLESKETKYAQTGTMKKLAWTFKTLRGLKNAAVVLSFGEGASVQIDNVSLMPKEKVTIEGGSQSMDRDISTLKTIKYVMNDDDDDRSPASNADSNPFYYEKGSGTISLAAPYRNGYEFAGWSLVQEVKYVEDYVTEVSTDTDSITLYAHWGERVTDSKEPPVENAKAPIIMESPSSTTYKIGDTPSVMNVTARIPDGSAGELSYQWYSGPSEDEMTAIEGATKSSYQPDISVLGVTYYYCLVTNTDSSVTGEKTASEKSRCISITVTGLTDAQTPLFKAHPQDAVYNLGMNQTGVVASLLTVDVYLETASAGIFSFQWYSGPSEDEMTAIEGATESSYRPDISELGETYYYCVVTNTNNEVPGNKTAQATSNTALVKVTGIIDAQTPVISANPIGANYEAGAAANPLSVTAFLEMSSPGVLSYQWYGGASEDEMTAIDGATESTYQPDTSKAGVTYYYCIVTNTNEAAPGNKTAQKISETAKITVSGKDASTPFIIRHPVSSNYTYGHKASALMVEVFPVSSGTISYQWYMSASAETVGIPIAGAIASTYVPDITSVGQRYYYCVVKNTDPAATGAKEVTTKSNAAAISVVKAPGVINVVTEINKTYGNKPFSLNATGYGNLTYVSSNSSIVEVNAGIVTIKDTGKAVITIYASGDANHHPATGKVTVNVAPKKVTGVKVKVSGINKATVRWKKDKKATGYQIQYSTNSKFKSAKTATISKNKAKKPGKTISKLKKGKRYYIRVRSFKNKEKEMRVYGAWSAKKKVKIR